MLLSISNFCLAAAEPKSCSASIQIAEKLQSFYRSRVTVFGLGTSKIGFPPSFDFEPITDSKNLGKHFKSSKNELMIVPLQMEGSQHGVISVANANKLIDHLERMVLTVPENKNALAINKIIVPIDSSFETRQKIPYALAMARAFSATICLLGVSSDKGKDSEFAVKNYLSQVSRHLEEKGFNHQIEMRLGGNPTDQVISYAAEIGAGMIVIMTEQETNFTSLFSGKYSQQMVKKSTVPVLSIHPKDLIVSDARL